MTRSAERDRVVGPWLAPAVLIAAVALVYSSSFGGAFVFDDLPNIVDNPSIRSVRPLADTLWPPPTNIGVAGRPVVNLSLALNWAISGDDPWSYHLVNLLIHALATLALYGIVHLSVTAPPLDARFHRSATSLALATALLWAIHPLQTEAVTYVVQRCESLMGLLFLFTLYCAIRGWRRSSWRGWHGLAVASCLLGVGCKETIAVAPVLVLLYDVIFNRRRPIDALRRSRGLYTGLALCLTMLVVQVSAGGTARGAPWEEYSPWLPYVLTQAQVTVHYLGLALWPGSLCLDYAWPLATPAATAPFVLVMTVLVTLSLIAIARRHPLGYLGAWFFGTLAPPALVPMPDVAFEHRMYLPLAAVAAAVVIAVRYLGRRLPQRFAAVTGWSLLVIVVVMLGLRTHARNLDYRDPVALWTDIVEERPSNSRAFNNLATLLEGRVGTEERITLYRRAITADPGYATAHWNLALLFQGRGDHESAMHHYREAVRLNPNDAGWRNDLAMFLRSLGRVEEAIEEYRTAVRINPDWPQTSAIHFNLGLAYEEIGRLEDAITEHRHALELDPEHLPARERLDELTKSPE